MSQRTPLERSQNRWSSTIAQVLRSPIVWLSLLVVLAMATLIMGTRWVAQASTSVPADVFMQSVVKRDGALGWQQLCPALQRESPVTVLSDQARTSSSPSPGRLRGAHAEQRR